jgi:hypothetical protein
MTKEDWIIKNLHERLTQHEDNLLLWENGFLTPTEPDENERDAVVRELRAAIYELNYALGLLGDEKGYQFINQHD